MIKYDTIKTKTWQLSLPADWQEKGKRDEGSLYFESGDETKGLYVSVWRLRKSDHKRDVEGTFRTFLQTEIEGFNNMEDCRWAFSKASTTKAVPVRTATVGVYDRKRKYRIIAKLIVGLPYVIRSGFHDYVCPKPDASKRYFAPIVRSLKLIR